MQARMRQPAVIFSNAMTALHNLHKSIDGKIPAKTAGLVHLRVSQINGCSVCVAMHLDMLKGDDTFDRLFAVSAWRDSPVFTPAERAALALAEAVTRVADQADPVPDALWAEVTQHYDEEALAALLLSISSTNVWNRLNLATRQVAGAWKKS